MSTETYPTTAAQLATVIDGLESIDWHDVPHVTNEEAATLARRLETARQELTDA